MELRRWRLIGQQGKLIKSYPVQENKGNEIQAPLLEISSVDFFPPKSYPSFTAQDIVIRKIPALTMLEKIIGPVYKAWGKFGPYDDMIQITWFSRKTFVIDFIGQLAWPKPALATDLIPFIRDAKGNLFFIGITRKKSPGKGKPALIGGHLDVKGYHLETAVEALIHEAKDEAGFSIRVIKEHQRAAIAKPNMERVPVSVAFSRYQSIPAELLLVGTFETSAQEKMIHLGIKRIYQTTAYAMIIDLRDVKLNEQLIASMLQAGDDAASIWVHKIKSPQPPPFAIKHHKAVYQQTLKKLRDEQRITIKSK